MNKIIPRNGKYLKYWLPLGSTGESERNWIEKKFIIPCICMVLFYKTMEEREKNR